MTLIEYVKNKALIQNKLIINDEMAQQVINALECKELNNDTLKEITDKTLVIRTIADFLR